MTDPILFQCANLLSGVIMECLTGPNKTPLESFEFVVTFASFSGSSTLSSLAESARSRANLALFKLKLETEASQKHHFEKFHGCG